jgi:hypothetical protein
MAYFTTYATADGGVQISLGTTTTEPVEEVREKAKYIQVKNTGDYECYVRVKAFAGAEYQDGLKYSDESSGKWNPSSDGYWYYSEILPAGETTDTLKVGITFPEEQESFNVVVVQECTPVVYDADGNPYADWNGTVVTEEVGK